MLQRLARYRFYSAVTARLPVLSLLTGLLLMGPLVVAADQAEDQEFAVFILAGQSNMVGHGKPEMGRNPDYDDADKSTQKEVPNGIGSLRWYVAQHPERLGPQGETPLLNADGTWIERDDVAVHFVYERGVEHGMLTPHFGKGKWFGPEFGFGHVVGNALDEPVLIIKTAWGGHSLGVEFRPPSAGQPDYQQTKVDPERVGISYRAMIESVHQVLADKDTLFPHLAGKKPRLVGFGWHQGWNDGGSVEMVTEYESNMRHLIADLRRDLEAPELRIVIANSGMIGINATGRRADLCEIQMGMADPQRHPDLAGGVAAVETRPFKRSNEQSPSGFGFHWNHNAESHWLVGEAMGKAMLGQETGPEEPAADEF